MSVNEDTRKKVLEAAATDDGALINLELYSKNGFADGWTQESHTGLLISQALRFWATRHQAAATTKAAEAEDRTAEAVRDLTKAITEASAQSDKIQRRVFWLNLAIGFLAVLQILDWVIQKLWLH